MPHPWPPPPTDEAPWHTRQLRDIRGAFQVVVREVRLWGHIVLVDEHDAIWCPSCRAFVTREELLAVPFSGHVFDKRPRRRAARPLLQHDDPPVRRPRARDAVPENW
jgi:hypothetical protein